MQTKNPRIKFYRSWAINDTASEAVVGKNAVALRRFKVHYFGAMRRTYNKSEDLTRSSTSLYFDGKSFTGYMPSRFFCRFVASFMGI